MFQRRLLIATVALLLLAACTGRATPTVVPTATPVPVTTDLFETGGHVFDFTRPNLMHDAAMTWVKFQVVYSQGDTLASVQTLVNKGHTEGFKVLLSIKGVPSEMSASGYNAEFAAFVGAVAAFQPEAIEVWNEANIDREWPVGQINGTNYTALLKLVYPAVKAANASTLVISGAPAPTGFFSGQCAANGCDDNIFLNQMAGAGAVNFMDCLGIHYNVGVLPPDVRTGDPRGNSSHYSWYYPAMVDLYTSIFPSKPLCFTEIGYLSPEGYSPPPVGFEWATPITVQNQSDWLAQAQTIARQSKRVRLFIVWNVDATIYGSDPQAGYAIIRPNGNCPACDALGASLES